MQNWLFVHDGLYWTNERAKALLTSVPQVININYNLISYLNFVRSNEFF